MNTIAVRSILIASVVLALAGCSSAGKRTKSTATASTSASTNPFLSSSKKVQQDFTQTETDLGSLESEIKVAK